MLSNAFFFHLAYLL